MIIIISGEAYQAKQYLDELRSQALEKKLERYFLDGEEEKDLARKLSDLLAAQTLFRKEKFIVARSVSFELIKEFCEEYGEKVGQSELIFSVPGSRVGKIASKNITHKHFEMPKGALLAQWMKKELQTRGMKPDQELLNYLLRVSVQVVTLYALINEIEKLSLAKNYQKELYALQAMPNAFAITEALSKRDVVQSVVALERQFQDGQKALDILIRVIWQLRVLLLVSDYALNAKRYTLSLHPFVIKKAQDALRFFSSRELNDLFLEAISLYEKILYSSMPSEVLLSLFFLRFS